MSSKNASRENRGRRMRRVPSDDRTRLDKYKHLVYNEDVYDSEEFLEDLAAKSRIQRKPKDTV